MLSHHNFYSLKTYRLPISIRIQSPQPSSSENQGQKADKTGEIGTS